MSLERYADLLALPHPNPRNHVRMPQQDRAAQFAPYAALVGYGEEVQEMARLTESRWEQDETSLAELDSALQQLLYHLRENGPEAVPQVKLRYFVEDGYKDGGAFHEYTGRVKRLDEYRRCLQFTDGKQILLDAICRMEELPTKEE